MTCRNPGPILLLLAVAIPGCIASNVLDEDRRHVVAPNELVFSPAVELALPGFYESTDVTGEVAASLRKVYYLFAGDGTYTAAALLDDGGTLAFQTLRGTWSIGASGLVLDGGDPVPVFVAEGHVRFTAPGGVLTLRRSTLP